MQNVTWPYFSPLSTKEIVKHFDEEVYDTTPTSHIYRFISALVGEAGAGDLVKQSLIARANQDIETTWFKDLDALFSNILGFQRMPEETYDYEANHDALTLDQLLEVTIKDAWYRARVKDLLTGLQHGGTVEGFKFISRAITSVDADIYETWRYRYREDSVGRLSQTNEREIVIVPHKSNVSEKERQLLLKITDRVKPADSFVTIDTNGLAIHSVLNARKVASDSSYFEVRKEITNTIDMSKIPPPEYLADELYQGQKWLYEAEQGEAVEAPEAAFSTTQEFSQYYAYAPDNLSQIVDVSYLALSDNVYYPEASYVSVESTLQYTEWIRFPIADSPDNYPGGKNGKTPMEEPAVTPDGKPYKFEWDSQEKLEELLARSILNEGGVIDIGKYKLPVYRTQTMHTFETSGSISSTPPQPRVMKASWFSDKA